MTPQSTIAHYRITAKLGEGGMGAVYRATDTKLNRDVAIKVLPPAFAEDAARMARFEREAQVLASLYHPNIAAIYGIEHGAIVMELVEGEDLKGPVPVETAIAYARQIAIALEAAHEKGIIHRDLKPANIKVTPEGQVKLLDFGLAKAPEQNLPSSAASPTLSPTLSLAMTQAGMILGTAAYMSPEQARGKPVDKRTDIWAFGVVFYEMLAGRDLYGGGETITDTLAAVVMKDPDWSALPAETPQRIRHLLQRCLQKDPKLRLRDIGEARVIIHESEPEPAAAAALSAPPAHSWPWRIAAAVLAVFAAALGFGWWRASRPAERAPMRLSVDLGPGAVVGGRSTAILSPDGSRIVFHTKSTDGRLSLASRLLEQPNATPLSGTEVATTTSSIEAFFSPDGQWLAFHQGSRLMKVPLRGGPPEVIAETGAIRGGSWGEDGSIVFGSASSGVLLRVPPSGGPPKPLTNPESTGDLRHYWPQILPGGKAVLFTALKTSREYDNADIDVLSLETGKWHVIHHGGYMALYLSCGYLVYLHQGSLLAAPFDLKSLRFSGNAIPMIDDSALYAGSGAGQFDISQNGTLVYRSGKSQGGGWPVEWMDSAGKTTPILATPGAYSAPALSPDGKRLAYTLQSGKGNDLWVDDIARDTPTQLTFNAQRAAFEVAWAPDGKHLVYGAQTPEGFALWWIRSDGSGQPEQLLKHPISVRPQSFSPDGRRLVYSFGVGGLPDLWILPLDTVDPDHPKPGSPEPFLTTPAVEVDGSFSPDGLWIAYASNESGNEEIFVRPYPLGSNGGGKVRISTGGGKYPTWSRASHELFFLGGDDRIMVTDYAVKGETFDREKPRPWSDKRVLRTNVTRSFDLAPDGKRVVIFPRPAEEGEKQGTVHVTFVLNFFDELRRRVHP